MSWDLGPPAPYLRGAGFAAGGAALWLVYFYLKDRLRPEPRRLILGAFLLGGLSALLALAIYRLAELAGVPGLPRAGAGAIFAYTVGVVGTIEEGTKFLVARAIVFRWRAFDEPLDGIVYAAALGIGFATLENGFYLPDMPWHHQLARALASPLTHSLFAAVWGFGVGRAFFSVRSRAARILWQAIPLLAAMLLHGLYDFFLLAMNATLPAGAVILVLWIGLIVTCRRLAQPGGAPPSGG